MQTFSNNSTTNQYDLRAYINEGIAQATSGNKTLARAYFQYALQIDPTNQKAMLWLAWVAESPFDAVRILEDVLKINPFNETAKEYLVQARVRCEEVDYLIHKSTATYLRLIKKEAESGEEKAIPILGEYLVVKGYITQEELESALRHQEQCKVKGKPKRLGQSLMELGYLSKSQLEKALNFQKEEYDRCFGKD